jgi:hypothetical protein
MLRRVVIGTNSMNILVSRMAKMVPKLLWKMPERPKTKVSHMEDGDSYGVMAIHLYVNVNGYGFVVENAPIISLDRWGAGPIITKRRGRYWVSVTRQCRLTFVDCFELENTFPIEEVTIREE